VRVPVVVGPRDLRPPDVLAARRPRRGVKALADAPGLEIVDGVDADGEELAYPTPLASAGKDEVMVGRIREDLGDPNSLGLWVVGDNLLKGAALNAVQLAELVAEGR
jgi:aspartate-semialdehyde dehydrogenase